MIHPEENSAANFTRGRLLRPVPKNIPDTTNIGAYCRWLNLNYGLTFPNYQSLWRWSVDNLDLFWQTIIEFFCIDVGNPSEILANAAMPNALWLPGGEMSYAEQALRHVGPELALVGLCQGRERITYSRDELRVAVARCAAGLKRLGLARGDRVAAYLPNCPETIIAFLATASIGAIWVSCAPEFGVKAVVDRLSQVTPKILFAIGAYTYGDKVIDRREHVRAIRDSVQSIEATIDVPYVSDFGLDSAMAWKNLLRDELPLQFEKVYFDHPLYILFSSGTTGLPKAIVHGHGGILLEHCKALGLHNDVRDGDSFFWYSTTGWMVWNYGVSALLLGARVICFDGNPMYPDTLAMWKLAAAEGVTYFGNSASFFTACRNAEINPHDAGDLHAIRAIGSTGSVLPAEGFEWIAKHFDQIVIGSASGGTDVCSAFVSASPFSEIRAGEIAAPMLGCDAAALDESGSEVIGSPGELIIKKPMPSMPVGFWGDDGSRYRAAYFVSHPGVWTHGDWIVFFEDGASVITGRSDATLNRGGVRLGTADFYSVVEKIDGITDSLIVHLEDERGGPGELILFATGTVADAERDVVARLIKTRLKEELSPRHVPDEIVWLSAIPRTLTGKKIETPVKRLLKGEPLDKVASADSLMNASALSEITRWYSQKNIRLNVESTLKVRKT